MKKVILFAVVIAATLQGCIIKSIYPFFKEDDVVFRNELVGEWMDGDGNKWSIHSNPFRPNSYEMHCTRDNRDVAFAGNLFMLEGNLYLDLFPVHCGDFHRKSHLSVETSSASNTMDVTGSFGF